MKKNQVFILHNAIKSITYLLLIVFFVAGCTADPKTYKVGKLTEDQKKEIGKKLTADEGQKLTGWMIRQAMSRKDIPEGFTVGQALKEQDDWIAKEAIEEAKEVELKKQADELKKKAEEARKEKQEEFSKLISVALVSKKNSVGKFEQKWVGLEIAYENKSDKDIQGIKGVLKITDIFGDPIIDIGWTYDEGIQSGKTIVEKDHGIEINQFIPRHMKLWNTDYDKIKSSFSVLSVIFKDGTKIDSPE